MSPPNDRRVPRHPEPAPHEVLAKLKATIEHSHAQMAQIEERALSGHYGDRLAVPQTPPTGFDEGPSGADATWREANEARQWREPVKTVLGSQAGNSKAPEFTPPHIRVIQAEQRVMDVRARLEGIVERIVGPIPLQDTSEASDAHPWGGAMGEIADSVARIRYEIERMEYLLRALGEAVP